MMENSDFAKLPAELRNRIWELTVTSETTAPSGLPLVDITKSEESAITQTCKQIRTETLGMYYHNNTFLADLTTSPVDKTSAYLQSRTPEAAIKISRIAPARLAKMLPVVVVCAAHHLSVNNIGTLSMLGNRWYAELSLML